MFTCELAVRDMCVEAGGRWGSDILLPGEQEHSDDQLEMITKPHWALGYAYTGIGAHMP